jgi:hypothetical protein
MDNRKKRKTPIFRPQIIFVALGRVKQFLEKTTRLPPLSNFLLIQSLSLVIIGGGTAG